MNEQRRLSGNAQGHSWVDGSGAAPRPHRWIILISRVSWFHLSKFSWELVVVSLSQPFKQSNSSSVHNSHFFCSLHIVLSVHVWFLYTNDLLPTSGPTWKLHVSFKCFHLNKRFQKIAVQSCSEIKNQVQCVFIINIVRVWPRTPLTQYAHHVNPPSSPWLNNTPPPTEHNCHVLWMNLHSVFRALLHLSYYLCIFLVPVKPSLNVTQGLSLS